MADETQTELVEFTGTLAAPSKFEPPEVAGTPEAVIRSVKILVENPVKIVQKTFTRKDGTSVTRRSQNSRIRAIFDFPDTALDSKGRQLNKLGMDLRSDFSFSMYLDDFNGQPLAQPEPFTMLEDVGTHKVGETGKLVLLCRNSSGNSGLYVGDLPAYLTGKKVRVRNQPTFNPGTQTTGPKIVITAILS